MTSRIFSIYSIKPFLLLASLLLSLPALAVDAINTTRFGNVAIEGYDPVAYFTQSRPVKGDSDFEYEWKDAKWRFSSAENLALFTANPEKYAPQYGGYCAYAVAKNTTASIDPTQFTVVDFLAPIAETFRAYGGNAVGITELIASALILIPKTRTWGALLGLGVISGAIFFHLGTPLGVNRVVDEAGNTDGGALFYMACGVWLCCAALVYLGRDKIFALLGQKPVSALS